MLLKVWYVDDEFDLCEVFSDFFSSAEVEVKTFVSHLAALQEAKINPPDLLFLDYRLKGATGDWVAQQMDPAIPKYLVTGEASPPCKYPYLKVIYKPYRRQDLDEIIQQYLDLKQKAQKNAS